MHPDVTKEVKIIQMISDLTENEEDAIEPMLVPRHSLVYSGKMKT